MLKLIDGTLWELLLFACYLSHGVIFHFFDMQFSTYFVDGPIERRSSNQFCIYYQGILDLLFLVLELKVQ